MQILSQLFEKKTITEIALTRFFVPFPAFVFIDVLYRFILSLIVFFRVSKPGTSSPYLDRLVEKVAMSGVHSVVESSSSRTAPQQIRRWSFPQ